MKGKHKKQALRQCTDSTATSTRKVSSWGGGPAQELGLSLQGLSVRGAGACLSQEHNRILQKAATGWEAEDSWADPAFPSLLSQPPSSRAQLSMQQLLETQWAASSLLLNLRMPVGCTPLDRTSQSRSRPFCSLHGLPASGHPLLSASCSLLFRPRLMPGTLLCTHGSEAQARHTGVGRDPELWGPDLVGLLGRSFQSRPTQVPSPSEQRLRLLLWNSAALRPAHAGGITRFLSLAVHGGHICPGHHSQRSISPLAKGYS